MFFFSSIDFGWRVVLCLNFFFFLFFLFFKMCIVDHNFSLLFWPLYICNNVYRLPVSSSRGWIFLNTSAFWRTGTRQIGIFEASSRWRSLSLLIARTIGFCRSHPHPHLKPAVRPLNNQFGPGKAFLVISQKCFILESYRVGLRGVKNASNKTRAGFFSLLFSVWKKEALMPNWLCFGTQVGGKCLSFLL